MFAVVAFFMFLLELLDVHLGQVEWIPLGLMFVALYFLVPWPRDRAGA